MMKKVDFVDIEMAFTFVNFDNLSDKSAVINRETGEIHYIGDSVDEDLPEDFNEDDEALVWIPDKRDLGLGSELAMSFAREFCSEDLDDIQFIFSHSGAYAHFKRLLEKRNRLDKWYKFEDEKIREALLEWCLENRIEVSS